jgi:hypothetical protein
VVSQVEGGAEARLEKIGASAGVGELTRTGGPVTWKVALEPYDLVAARFAAPRVQLRNPVVTVPGQVHQALERRIADLVARASALGDPQPLSAVQNAGFEIPSAGDAITGWTAQAPMGGRAALDARFKHTGGQSLLLAGDGQPVSITSVPFDPPKSGRLTLEVYLRATDPARPPSLRMGIEGDLQGGALFNSHGLIERLATGSAPGGWELYRFVVDALPATGLTGVRVRLELLTAGEVWIDDVQVFDLQFDPQERNELAKIVSLANLQLDKKKYADCARLLEGYWPQYLVANVPLTTSNTPIAQRPQPAVSPPPPAPSEQQPPPADPPKKPGMLESLRGYIPKFR